MPIINGRYYMNPQYGAALESPRRRSYKLMPGGEVLRMYEIGRSGRIYLNMKPGEFRITQPNYPTVYMDDDELCKLKHDWIKRQFVVNLHPSKEMVAAARVRQRDRTRHMTRPGGEPPEAGR